MIAKVLEKTRLMKLFYRSVCQTAVTMLAYLPANPMQEDNESDMFDNLVPRSIEHFACSVLMDMDKDLFRTLSNVTPDTVKGEINRLAEIIDNHIVKNLVPADVELDEQILLRMASGNYIIPINSIIQMII